MALTLHLTTEQVERLGWMGSVGYWKFTPEYLHGTYTRAVSRDQGCQERLVRPDHVALLMPLSFPPCPRRHVSPSGLSVCSK